MLLFNKVLYLAIQLSYVLFCFLGGEQRCNYQVRELKCGSLPW
jgi:hypothetical protein